MRLCEIGLRGRGVLWGQIGRAGRDGREAQCHLFLDDADFRRLRSLSHSDQARKPANLCTCLYPQSHAVSPRMHALAGPMLPLGPPNNNLM